MLPSLDYPQGIISCIYTLPASGSPKTEFNTHFGKFEAMNQLISPN
jgi:hypothetical protein